MVYKSNIGDFPLKVIPCKWWWVRYAVACTRATELYDAETTEIFEKAGITIDSYRGDYSEIKITRNEKNETITPDDPQWKFLVDRMKGSPQWGDCSYEEKDQSKCSNYIESSYYKGISLKKLRKMKGYTL